MHTIARNRNLDLSLGRFWSAPEHFGSNGPFTLEHWERGECLVLKRHPRQTSPALFVAIWTADYPDPDDFLRVSRSDHWTGWQHVDYVALVEQARRDLDQAARLARYAQAERILAAEVPVLPLTYERDHLLLKPWVRRYPISGNRSMFWKDAALDARELYAGR